MGVEWCKVTFRQQLSDLDARSGAGVGQLELTAVRDEGKRIRQELKQKVRQFDSYDIDRLCREGDPELTEELWGSDMQALYRRNDELIDQLDIEDLRDLEAHYRLVQRHHLKITCKSCCSGLLPGCLIWDLGGNLRLIGNY